MNTKKKNIIHMIKYLSVLICAVSVLMFTSACTETQVAQAPESVTPEVHTEPASVNTDQTDGIQVPADASPNPADVTPAPAGDAQDPADIIQNPADEATGKAVQNDVPGRYDAVTRDLTEQLIRAYPEAGGGAKSRQLLRELRNVSPESSMVWEQILDYWDRINAEDFVNVVPESVRTKDGMTPLSADPSDNDTKSLPADQPISDIVPLPADLPVDDAESLPADQPVSDTLPLPANLPVSDTLPLPADLPDDDSLCIIILGYALNPDGTMKEELISRLRLGLSCALQYPNAYVMVTGGGTASANPQATEADCMAAWLLENGLDEKNPERLIIENRSMTSAENAVFCADIMKNSYPQIKNTVIVTTDYHVSLGCLLFESRFLLSKEDSAARTQETAEERLSAPQSQSGQPAVIANAGAPAPDKSAFTLESQAYWMLQLISYD